MGEKEHFDDWNFALPWEQRPPPRKHRRRPPHSGRDNPFYAPSTLPFQAPPFDKIKDSDYQPAIDTGMAMQINEVGGYRQQSRATHL